MRLSTVSQNHCSRQFDKEELVIARDLGQSRSFVINEIIDGYFKDGYSSVVDSTCHMTSDSSEVCTDTSGTSSSSNQKLLLQPTDSSLKSLVSKSRKQHRGATQSRYVIKRVRVQEDLVNKDDQANFHHGHVDLASEAKILSIIDNPNIISLKGVSNSVPGTKEYFLILDRLDETLEKRLMVWKTKETQLSNPLNKLLLRKKTLNSRKVAFNVERYHVALDLACAIKYLHSMNIMHRNIKPSNVGFDGQGDVKLFDFTSAREYNPNLANNTRDEHGCYYNMTQQVGTLRYMDPQVASSTCYNELCDVYSFCVVFWQILELTVPYSNYNVQLHKSNVIENNARPIINKKWSNDLQTMFQSGFGSMVHRITMSSVCDVLFNEVDALYAATSLVDSMTNAEQLLFNLR